ncbi:MAG: hypothetical protein ACFFAA_11510 [Promethearchaeota archaeon]
MVSESLISYWLDVHEFRLDLKKIVIPFKVFFRSKENYSNNDQSGERPTIEVEI